MDLHSTDGTRVHLRPTAHHPDTHRLIIEGHVQLADGPTWTFTDPALLTHEAHELGTWLTDVANGHIPVIPDEQAATLPDDDNMPHGAAIFTEPNLALSVAAYTTTPPPDHHTLISLRVHMAYESAPPWTEDIIVQLTCTPTTIAQAAHNWTTQLQTLTHPETHPPPP